MCTVTYIPSGKKTIITSNRDEHISRNAPLLPKITTINGKKVVYPKDESAGGTWFAMNENGVAAVLLNGAFKNHKRTPPYRRSRGLIVLEIISNENPVNFLEEINLQDIEPFTLVVFNQAQLWEFRWDGNQKHKKQLDSSQGYIWSSWTLYDDKAQTKRNQYFKKHVLDNRAVDAQQLLTFHKENHGDFENGFIIDRQNGLKTLSVTQVVLDEECGRMDHFDLDSGGKESVSIKSIRQIITQP